MSWRWLVSYWVTGIVEASFLFHLLYVGVKLVALITDVWKVLGLSLDLETNCSHGFFVISHSASTKVLGHYMLACVPNDVTLLWEVTL